MKEAGRRGAQRQETSGHDHYSSLGRKCALSRAVSKEMGLTDHRRQTYSN